MRRLKICLALMLALMLALVLALGCGVPVLAVDIDVGGGDFEYPDDTPGGGGGGVVISYYTVTVEDTENGSATASATRAPSGQTITITATPNEGYKVASVTVTRNTGNTEIDVNVQSDGRYTFTMPASNVTVNVTFARNNDPDSTGVSDWLITKEHIQYLEGYPGGSFGPNNNMTRAEAAQMFYNLLLDKNVSITVTFDDVDDDAWYAEAVNTLASLSIIDGVGNNRFDPERSITRAEFVTIAMRFTNGTLDGENIFPDVSEGAWYYDYVVGAIQYGWINGYPNGYFGPNDTITRAEVTAIVNRMLGRSADESYVDSHQADLVQFGDLGRSHWAYYNIMEATNAHGYTVAADGEDWTGLS